MILILVPAHASLAKIAAGAPAFIGEQNLDISSGLNGHSVIAWWPAGADLSSNPAKTVAIAGNATSFYLDPAVFTGSTGTWYTHDTQPDIPVFVVYQPQINLSIWDVDTNTDITGQSVPMSANITYRIDTNLDMALNYTQRPNYNPSDGFFTVTLTSPTGMDVHQIFTGNVGNPTTQIIPFDSAPIIRSSPYIWENGPAWDRNAKSTDGSSVYPTGTYTFGVTQNLNGMSSSYNGTTAIGTVTSGNKTVTFIADTVTSSPTVQPSGTAPVGTVPTTAETKSPSPLVTVQPTATVIQKKTTFSPLPASIALIGFGIAALVIAKRRKY
jgi:hypothetical protein